MTLPTNPLADADLSWHPFPHSYAGWWGHAVVRRRGTRLEVYCVDRVIDVASVHERQHWHEAIRALCPDCGVTSYVLDDSRGIVLGGTK